MKIEVSWYDIDKTIIIQKFPMIWVWEEYFDAIRYTVELEKTVEHPVYVIGTQPPNGQTPKGNIINQYNTAIKMHEDNMRYYIIATDNFLTAAFGNVFLKTTALRAKVRMVKTIDDALRFIEQDKA